MVGDDEKDNQNANKSFVSINQFLLKA